MSAFDAACIGAPLGAGDPEHATWGEWARAWHNDVILPHLCKSTALEPENRPDEQMSGAMLLQKSQLAQPQAIVDDPDRSSVVDWIIRVHEAQGLSRPTLYLAVQLVDQYRKLVPNFPVRRLTLLGATALLAAAKFEESEPPSVSSLVGESRGQFTADDVPAFEL